MVSLMSLLKKHLFPQLYCGLIRVNALDTNTPTEDNDAMIVLEKQSTRHACVLLILTKLCSVSHILGFKGDR